MRTFITLMLAITVLASCEGWIHLQGHVYDKETKQPLGSVAVFLQDIRSDRLIKNIKFKYDTIPYTRRMELRKQGIKDDYKYNDPNGLSILVPLQTDTDGFFHVAELLVGCVPKCPTYNVVLVKEGYKTLTVSGDLSELANIQLEKIK